MSRRESAVFVCRRLDKRFISKETEYLITQKLQVGRASVAIPLREALKCELNWFAATGLGYVSKGDVGLEVALTNPCAPASIGPLDHDRLCRRDFPALPAPGVSHVLRVLRGHPP